MILRAHSPSLIYYLFFGIMSNEIFFTPLFSGAVGMLRTYCLFFESVVYCCQSLRRRDEVGVR